ALARRLAANTVLVTPMTADELRQAVTRPADLAGIHPEPELVERVVADSQARPADLASLSTALLRTWERREGRSLTLSAYLTAGGMAAAVSAHAEDAYATLSAAEREAARAILLRLGAPDHSAGGDGGQATLPRSADLADVLTAAGPGGSAVLERLAEWRLIR